MSIRSTTQPSRKIGPYGASNNKLPKLAPPKFAEALVDVGAQGAAVSIVLR